MPAREASGSKEEETKMSDSRTKAAAEEAAADLEKLREDIAALRSDLTRLVKSMSKDAGDLSNEAQREARRLYSKLAKEGERSAKAVVHELEERPLTTLLIAFAIGFVGGRLLPR
jgi:ElaB/YqjD/DUF883 family membrane-anchored ribosome-binding protein